jgi:hypothetical protein
MAVVYDRQPATSFIRSPDERHLGPERGGGARDAGLLCAVSEDQAEGLYEVLDLPGNCLVTG